MSTEINIAGQPKLVSGTNIKTVNGNSLLGSGNINITSTPPRSRIVGARNQYINAPSSQINFGAIVFSGVIDVDIQCKLNTGTPLQIIRLYASSSFSSIVGAVQLATYTIPLDGSQSGRFIRRLRFYDIGGESEGEAYATYYVKSINPALNTLNDFNSADANLEDSNVGSLNGIQYIYLIAQVLNYVGDVGFESWVVEYGS